MNTQLFYYLGTKPLLTNAADNILMHLSQVSFQHAIELIPLIAETAYLSFIPIVAVEMVEIFLIEQGARVEHLPTFSREPQLSISSHTHSL